MAVLLVLVIQNHPSMCPGQQHFLADQHQGHIPDALQSTGGFFVADLHQSPMSASSVRNLVTGLLNARRKRDLVDLQHCSYLIPTSIMNALFQKKKCFLPILLYLTVMIMILNVNLNGLLLLPHPPVHPNKPSICFVAPPRPSLIPMMLIGLKIPITLSLLLLPFITGGVVVLVVVLVLKVSLPLLLIRLLLTEQDPAERFNLHLKQKMMINLKLL